MYKKLTKELSAKEAAEYANVQLAIDNGSIITEICPIEAITDQGICFANKIKFKKLLDDQEKLPAAIILEEDTTLPENLQCSVLISKEPQKTLIKIIEKFAVRIISNGTISDSAEISKSATLGKNVQIGANVSIGDNVRIGDNTVICSNSVIYSGAKVGDNCFIHSGVTIREYCEIGNNVILQNGCVIGADGFGYIQDATGLSPVPQIGNVVLADFVDVGANSCIDRATAGSTYIGYGTKIDNLVQIGHNVQIGKFTIVCGQVGIGGSTKIGDQCLFAGASKIKDHVTITSGVRLTGNSTILSHIRNPGDYAGFPAVPHKQWQKEQISLRRSIKKSSN